MDKNDPTIEAMTSDPNQANEIIAWLGLADNDYLAARTLLRRGLLVQGTILANSAIEKYLKTVHRIKNIGFDTRGEKAHNLVKLYKSLKETDSRKDLNESYLALLIRAYKLRYPDRLEKEYNLALNQGKMLVGLDETVFKIRSRIEFSGTRRPFKFDLLIHQKDETLMQANHTFGEAKREDLFKGPLTWYEMRVLKNGVWMEATYIAPAIDDGSYDVEGFRHGSSDREYLLQAAPIGQETKDTKTMTGK